jgi:type IV secretory pathway VirB10-like protein
MVRSALVVWTRPILPNGNSIDIDNLPATDVAGYAGLEDEVDIHTWQLLKGVALATLLGVGTRFRSGAMRVTSSRRCAKAFSRTPIAPVNVWSSASLMFSRRSRCGQIGRCALLFQRISC